MTELRDLSDSLKQKLGTGVVILGSAPEGKVFLVVSVSKDLTSRVQAGAVIRELAPLVGGGGGGRPDFAQAGGSNPAALDGALDREPRDRRKAGPGLTAENHPKRGLPNRRRFGMMMIKGTDEKTVLSPGSSSCSAGMPLYRSGPASGRLAEDL